MKKDIAAIACVSAVVLWSLSLLVFFCYLLISLVSQ